MGRARGRDQVICDGDEIVAFFDGAGRRRDCAHRVPVETGYVFTVDVWEAPPAAPMPRRTWTVPVGEVDAAVERMFDRWDVRAFFADVREWESFTKVTWPERYGEDPGAARGAASAGSRRPSRGTCAPGSTSSRWRAS